jgi:hypothetical protein
VFGTSYRRPEPVALSSSVIATIRRDMANDQHRFSNRIPFGLFIAGLGLRLPGLLFNGMPHDLDQMILQWGSSVRSLGLAAAFRDNYGMFSYALYGVAAGLAEYVPRFWWLPYKAMEVSAEAAVLFALCRLLPDGRSHVALFMYWLNPWFIVHGAWQGFWEGPHTLFVLLALLCLRQVRNNTYRWVLAGICLMTGAMFKPQGLIYFVGPVGLYLILQLLCKGRPHLNQSPLIPFLAGLFMIVAVSTTLLVMRGADVLAIPKNYTTAITVMPNLCNECINIWRPVTRVLQMISGQSGPTDTLRLPRLLYTPLQAVILSFTIGLIGVFSWMLLRARSQPFGEFLRRPADENGFASYLKVFMLLAFAGIVFPQLATRAHINHAYAGLVLLIPLAAANRPILVAWMAMTASHFYGHIATYQLGRSVIFSYNRYVDYSQSRVLISQIEAAMVTHPYEALLNFQARINHFLVAYLPQEPLISLISAMQFVCLLVVIREMFTLVSGSNSRSFPS